MRFGNIMLRSKPLTAALFGLRRWEDEDGKTVGGARSGAVIGLLAL
jgi:hypothetical protein